MFRLQHAAKFMDLAGGTNAKLVIIPGGEEDESSFASYFDVWKDYEPLSFHMLNATSRDQANSDEFTSVLDEATGVWLGGGQPELADQSLRLTHLSRTSCMRC